MKPTVISTIHSVGVRAILRSGTLGLAQLGLLEVGGDGAGSGATRTEARCRW